MLEHVLPPFFDLRTSGSRARNMRIDLRRAGAGSGFDEKLDSVQDSDG
jgi:hypothetical protein